MDSNQKSIERSERDTFWPGWKAKEQLIDVEPEEPCMKYNKEELESFHSIYKAFDK